MGKAFIRPCCPRKKHQEALRWNRTLHPKLLPRSWVIFLCRFFADTAQLPSQGRLERKLLSSPFQSVGVEVNKGSPYAPVWCSDYSVVVLSFVPVLRSERNHAAPPQFSQRANRWLLKLCPVLRGKAGPPILSKCSSSFDDLRGRGCPSAHLLPLH